MAFWKFIIVIDGRTVYQDCGFETETDAVDEGFRKAEELGLNEDEFAIECFQVWQVLDYPEPKLVRFFNPEEQEECSGIAYYDEVICLCCGDIFKLGEVEIIEELPWKNISCGKSQRTLLKGACEAMTAFLETDPLKGETDEDSCSPEIDEIFDEGKNFLQAVENAGYDF